MDITLEVTRKCNLKCCHCIRGNAQNKTIQDNVLYSLSKENINLLTITGGEPTLVSDLFQRFKQYGIIPQDMWTCTNGKVFKKKWAREFFEYLKNLNQDIGGLSVSTDSFHPKESKMNYYRYGDIAQEYGFDVCKHGSENIIHEGNAKYGREISSSNAYDWKSPKLKEDYDDRQIYITIDGDVLYGCNWSYKRMKHLVLGNITEKRLETILEECQDTYEARYSKAIKMLYEEL